MSNTRLSAKVHLTNACTILLFLVVSIAYAYYVAFSGFESYDDEGYLMISLKGFLSGHPLYDEVFSQYGPFYYFYHWIIRSLAAIPLTHDATRMLCLIHWLAAAAILAIATGLFLRSKFFGLVVFVQALVHLRKMANEPGHPQEVTAFLLALGVLVTVVLPGRAMLFAWLGTLAAALAFTKVNVGGFYCLALALAIRCHSGDSWARGWRSRLPVLAGCAVPFLLMRQHLAEAGFRDFCWLVSVTLLVTGLAAQVWSPDRRLGMRCGVESGLGFTVSAVAIVVVVLLHGTSGKALFDGLITAPSKLAQEFRFPPPMFPFALLNLAVSTAVFAFSVSRKMVEPPGFLRALQGVFGFCGAVLFVSYSPLQLNYLLPWIWLVLVPGPALPNMPGWGGFVRAFLCLASAWQALQVYPVPGTQVSMATFLQVAIYSICLHDAGKALAASDGFRKWVPGLPSNKLAWTPLLAHVCLLFMATQFWFKLPQWRAFHESLEALDLPGARRLRVEPGMARFFREISQYLESHCDTFFSCPGVNSIHFWSGKMPPNYLNTTGWPVLLDDRQQCQIVDSLRRAKQPLILFFEKGVQGWGRFTDVERGPVIRFLRQECREVARFSDCRIYAPSAAKP